MLPSRRATLAATASLVVLTACSAGESPGASRPVATTGAGFPVTLATKFGDVTITAAPRRVVALGWGDAETALALRVQPVGASDWIAFGGEGVGSWAAGRYDTAPEIVGTLEPSYEAIAALAPDLILDVKSSGEEDRYRTLSAIAPTLGVPEGGDRYLTTLEDQVSMIARALGEEGAGQALLAGVDAAFAEVAGGHPQWAGRTVTAAARSGRGWGAYIDGSSRLEFLEKLGFVQNPQIAALPVNGGGFSVDVSPENLTALDADAIVLFPISVAAGEITGDPVWQALSTVADGRALVLDPDVAHAYALGSVLSLQYALDALVPLLEGLGDL